MALTLFKGWNRGRDRASREAGQVHRVVMLHVRREWQYHCRIDREDQP
jgi:hypothetical protein